jgi:hypothetical protein
MKAGRLFIFAALVFLINSPMIIGDEQAQANNSQPITVCNICSNASSYDGKMVVISGVFERIFHGSIIGGSESCPKSEINFRLASDYKSEKSVRKALASLTSKDPHESVDVVVRGIFRIAKKGECFGQICASYDIEVNEMFSAKPHHGAGQKAE